MQEIELKDREPGVADSHNVIRLTCETCAPRMASNTGHKGGQSAIQALSARFALSTVRVSRNVHYAGISLARSQLK